MISKDICDRLVIQSMNYDAPLSLISYVALDPDTGKIYKADIYEKTLRDVTKSESLIFCQEFKEIKDG